MNIYIKYTYKNKSMLRPLLKENYTNNNGIIYSLYNDNGRLQSPSQCIGVKMKFSPWASLLHKSTHHLPRS